MLVSPRGWTSRCHEAIAVRRVGVLEGMTPMQFSRFGAVSSRSGPRIREVCIEAISLRASGRCTRLHEEIAVRALGVFHLRQLQTTGSFGSCHFAPIA